MHTERTENIGTLPHGDSRCRVAAAGLLVGICVLFAINLLTGSVCIPVDDVVAALTGGTTKPTWHFIVVESRLPQAITAAVCGGSLALCGLLLQAIFHNPLADSSILGISSGASLGVGLVTLAAGTSLAVIPSTMGGMAATMMAALVGALAVTALMLALARHIQNNVLVLIVGIMVGYLASSVVTILSALASEDGLRTFVVWGMGSFGNVTSERLGVLLVVQLIGMGYALTLAKPLNTWMLGRHYAESLGLRPQRLRNQILAIVGLLSAVTTAYCGPVAFIGLAVPHMARMLVGSDDFRKLLPLTLLAGGLVALACNVVCTLPSDGTAIPLNAVTPLVGAPVVVYVIMRKNKVAHVGH